MPPSDVAGSGQALVMSSSAEKDACPVQEMTSISQTLGDDHNDKDGPVNSHTPSWDEIVELLKQVPYFTKLEPPSTDMNDFFPLTNRFFMKMAGDLSIIVAPRLPRGTPEFVISRIQPMMEYTAVETIEVVVTCVCNLMQK
ncbi:uncharacterized protein LOC117915339 isoform X2 [Vitis riparia]|uniref:uncharacterized protein LOC117915339 isoform X2 n=1 Tax=Vitis riparia TaxID=96939 RepID=UPI00155A4148|nr:uncharacterized protein LOC117915339 isoform X2 [Vitis riparia]XP_034686785.1 uncharacterized protein LOC117915339 isoform X2 [Vitis riparia]